MTLTTPTRRPELLDAAAAVADALTGPATVRWGPDPRRAALQSLAGGAVGVALLHAERARTGHGDEAVAHRWLALAAGQPLSIGGNANLFNGAPALGYALHTAALDHRGYRRALRAIDEHTIALTRTRLDTARARRAAGGPLTMREFDLVHGLTGLGVYLLARHSDHPVTTDLLTHLTRLTEPTPGASRPAWWIAGGLNGEPDPQYPDGHGNLGVAHGISAVIALLALAALRGAAPPGAGDALRRLCAWTDRCRQHDHTGTWWPGYLTPDQHQHRAVVHKPRPSWCYGVAGVARAQQLAGLALHDNDRRAAAEQAILDALADPDLLAVLPERGLCHGKAGLLQAAWRIHADAPDADLADAIEHLAGRLAQQLLREAHEDPELLDGTAGAALALHTTATATPIATARRSGWDAFLLLA